MNKAALGPSDEKVIRAVGGVKIVAGPAGLIYRMYDQVINLRD